MALENNVTKEKTSKINAIKDKVFREEVGLERVLALKASLESKLSMFKALRDNADAHTDAIVEILSKVKALARFLSTLDTETSSLTRWSEKACKELLDTFYRLELQAEQICALLQMLSSLEDIVRDRRAKNPLISKDLVDAIDRAMKRGKESLAASIAALEASIPSVRNVRDALGSWEGNLRQLAELKEGVINGKPELEEPSLLDNLLHTRKRSESLRQLAHAAYEKANEQQLAADTQATIDQALLDSTVAALKAARSAVAAGRFA